MRLAGRGLGSVRARTTLAATVVVGIVLATVAWTLLATLERALERSQDDAARGRARDIAALVVEGHLPRSVSGIGDDSFAQVVAEDGTVLAASPNIEGEQRVDSFVPRGSGPDVRTASVRDDGRETEEYRVWTLRTRAPDDPVVHVGTSLESVSEAVSTLRGLLVTGVPLTTLLLGVLTWLVVGRALAPVGAISQQVEAISDAGVDRRVPEPQTGDEIAHLARTMNAMLGRLAASAAGQRAFVADASHELQSPLTRFRAQLEVALADPSATDWDALARDLLADSGEMERLVHDLLFLARGDEAGPAPATDDLVDLDDVVLEETVRLRAGSRVVIDATAVSAAPVRGSREQLARLVRNLLENAQQHATSRVDVTLRDGDAGVELVVRDDGPGIPPDQRRRVFDRFVRLDDARSRQAGGSGLGLAIVDSVARRHGGTIDVGDGPGGATFVVRLPPPVSES